ncbi:MAG: hypothetical protein LBS85_00305 [Clostridiales Family XIII bacterium]|jgi:hypothetical protein|nr:hypothetical protein [Clostridiales Family XIII bacterium]
MKTNIIRWIICILYGAFTLVAAVAAAAGNIVPFWLSLLMGAAAVFLIILNIKTLNRKTYLVLLPLILLHICAVANGYYLGENNIVHHFVRLAVSVIIFILFYLSARKRNAE